MHPTYARTLIRTTGTPESFAIRSFDHHALLDNAARPSGALVVSGQALTESQQQHRRLSALKKDMDDQVQARRTEIWAADKGLAKRVETSLGKDNVEAGRTSKHALRPLRQQLDRAVELHEHPQPAIELWALAVRHPPCLQGRFHL